MILYERRSRSVKAILFTVLGTIGLLLFIALSIIVTISNAKFNEVAAAQNANQVTDLFFASAGYWAQERGLTNLRLNAESPANQAEISQIRTLRDKADRSFHKAQAALNATSLKGEPTQQRALSKAYARLQGLRRKVDSQLVLPGAQRDADLKAEWFPSISLVIEQSQLSALHYSSQSLNTTSVLARDVITRHSLWLMSEYAGRERGLMAGIIASGHSVSADQRNALLEYRAYIAEGWRTFNSLEMRPDERAVLRPYVARVVSEFFGDYETRREQATADGLAGRPYRISAQSWFDSATVAIDSILELEKANTLYVDTQLELQRRYHTELLWLCAAFLAVGVFITIAAFWTVNRHVLYSVSNLRAIFDNAGEGLITIDAAGNIRSFNPACERIFQANTSDVIGKNIRDLMPEPYRTAHDDYLAHYHKTGKGGIIGTMGREVRGRRLSGEEFPMELSISKFELEDGIHFCGVVRDVTAIRQAERDRQLLLEKLIESNTELERFAYVASHDMQEPIRMVMTFSQIIVEDYGAQLDDKGREYLTVLSESAHRMLSMIQDLLQFARLGVEGMTWSDVDMNDALKQVKIDLADLIADTSTIIDSDPLPRVAGNPIQLERVLQNLISNGIKYQPTDHNPIIRIRVEEEETLWRFSVSDNGIGIAEEFFPHIFEPFRRLHTQEEVKGTGFGLSIVKKIIENHGGSIAVSSMIGCGSAFSFTLKKAHSNK